MDFTASGVADLPPTTAESLQRGDPRVLSWLKEALQDGDRINRADPSYEQIEPAMRYIVGEQLSPDRKKLKYLPQVVINESRKAMQAHVSTLTDLKPLFGWKTLNPNYERQANLLNQYAIAEWVTTMADLDLGDCIKICLAAGTGDLVVDWDPHAPFGGASAYSARDPRDTLPIRPSKHRSVQLWEGVTLREDHTVNALRGMYPGKAPLIRAASDSILSTYMGKFRTIAKGLISPSDALDALGAPVAQHSRQPKSGTVVTYRTYLHDRTRNMTGKPIVMGTPGTNWCYIAQPNEPLYPRGRSIVWTDDLTLYDGPNPYWHGMFPVCRLRLWSVPWQFLGIPLFNDLLPVQDAINDTANDIRLAIQQWLDPDVIYNRNAISEASMRTIDGRRPGKRLKVNPGFGEAYEKKEGPNPQIIALASEMFDKLISKHNDLSGTANLSALLQLRQLPSADTISKYYEALTPEIRQEARMIEAFMRDMAEMTKVNYFQFLSNTKRRLILGNDAVALEDFDFDPGTLVPAMSPADPGYTPELDPTLATADERAQFFHRQFVFVVAPNSILALNSTERRMQVLQQAQMGYVDFWTFHEVFETPNVGAPPAIPLPPLKPVAQEEMMQLVAGMANSLQTLTPPQPLVTIDERQLILDPASGQVMEIRVPSTVTERLQAQQMLGIGMTVSSQGRKATNEAPAKAETKNDEPGGRTTTTTSSK